MNSIRRSACKQLLAACFFGSLISAVSHAADSAAPGVKPQAAPHVATQAPAPAPTALPGAAASAHGDQPIALVNGKSISTQEYEALFVSSIRERFYHGKIPEGETEKVRKETLERLIDRALMEQEAEKRGLKPDQAKVDEAVAGYEKTYGSSATWQQQRERLLPGLRAQLGRMDILEQMEKSLRQLPAPTPAEVRSYYDQHPANFTEPEKIHLSMIMLRVDPSSSKIVWEKAREEAQAIYKRLKAGADFAELAKVHSNDDSGARGGDLGYLHRGMLPEALESQVNSFKQGVVAEPITLLEGVALFRVDGRIAPKLREFKDVEKRAGELFRRDRETQARVDAIARLRKDAKIEVRAPISGGGNTPIN